jgi:hypothetical protein
MPSKPKNAARAVVLPLVLASLPVARAVAEDTATRPAVWFPHDLIIDLQNLPKRYSCDDLWYKFRDVLLTIGARPDMRIFPYECNTRSPRVHLQFSLPQPASGAWLKNASLQATSETKRLEPGHPRSLDAADCALLQQVKDTLLPALPVRVVSYRLTCSAPTSSHPRFYLSVQTLSTAPRNERQVAAHDRGWPQRKPSASGSAPNG